MRVVTGLLFLLLSATAPAASLDVRLILCPRAIADSIKKNIDSGTLPEGAFETTYDQLAGSRQVVELARLAKDLTGREKLRALPTTKPGKGVSAWDANLALDISCSEAYFSVTEKRVCSPPGAEKGLASLTTECTAELAYNTWHLMDETSVQNNVVLSLIQVRKPEAPKYATETRPLVVDGYFIPTDTNQAAALEKKSHAEIIELLPRLMNPLTTSFRYRGSSGQKSSHQKGDTDLTFYERGKWVDMTATRLKTELVMSPDRKLVDCSGPGNFSAMMRGKVWKFEFPVAHSLPTGEWRAIPAARGMDAVLLLKVSDFGDPSAPLPQPINQKPLNPANSNTQSYTYQVQPGAMRTFQALAPEASAKEIFIKAGLQDNGWNLLWKPRDSAFELIADLPSHAKFRQLLEEKSLLWGSAADQ